MLLINPAREKFGGFLSRYVPVGIPVAIGALAAYLKKHGIKVRTVDEEVTDIAPGVLRELAQGLERPFIFGISCLTAHAARGYQLAEMVKAEFPGAVVICGGLHCTALPEEALNTGYVDYVVRGEGEEVLLQLHNALRGGSDPTRINGISFKREGTIIHNPEAPLIADLDSIPSFPYELFDHPKYDRGFLSTSRGCPYKCTFCSQRMMTGPTYRYRSAEKVMEDLDILINHYGEDQIVFYDDNFCFKRDRVTDLCKKFVEAGFNRKCAFSVQTRADNFTPDIAPVLAEAGFRHVGFGMETGVNRLAELIGKGETVEQHLEALALAKKHGMETSLFMIFGFPTETKEDRRTSFKIVQSAKVEASKYNNLIPYPGTPLYNDLRHSDRIHIEPGWSNFNSTLSVTRSIFDKTPLPYVPETASEFELKREIVRYNLKAYLTPRAVLAILLRKKGVGWYSLPKRWYLKPRELYEMAKIGVNVLVNMIVAFLPLAISEPIMNALNPAMRQRPRIPGYKSEDFRPSGWDIQAAREKARLLRTASQEVRTPNLETNSKRISTK